MIHNDKQQMEAIGYKQFTQYESATIFRSLF